MSDQASATGSLQIPPEIQKKFGGLVDMIKRSESMNLEERQYWVNILPIMTPEQIKNLEEILVHEKEQLAAIDAKYAEKTREAEKSSSTVQETGEKIREQKRKRDSVESASEEKEAGEEASILERIRNM